ncbi:MAG: hypothetical protein VX486_09750, partial [Pseudomonadota bacterium]|nr:hypothetical protein [Pseudomonadota bacterium]
SAWVHDVPASYCVMSRMRIPSRAGIQFPRVFPERRLSEHPDGSVINDCSGVKSYRRRIRVRFGDAVIDP